MKNRNKLLGKRVKYEDGEVVFEEGSDSREVYFILSGKVEVSRNIAGKKEVVAILKKDEFFGEMAALNDDVRSMTITAIGELRLCQLSPDEMLEYMQRKPEVLWDVCATLAGRLKNTNAKLRAVTLRAITSNENQGGWRTDTSHVDELNILVVDDNPNIITTLKQLLSEEYNVFTALDGKSALRIMELSDIALVLTDYRMPGMSGTELLESIKQMYPDAVRIILADSSDRNTLMKALREVQVHEIMPKSWMPEEFRSSLARWAEQYRQNKQLKEKASQYAAVKNRLEEANELTQQLVQELKEASVSEYSRALFWRRIKTDKVA